MSRETTNKFYETLLDLALRERHIPEEYHFGICEREETEYSKLYGKTTFTYWNLALYKITGMFGERVLQIYGTPIISESNYDKIDTIVKLTLTKIEEGYFDKYNIWNEETNYAPTECLNKLFKICYPEYIKEVK